MKKNLPTELTNMINEKETKRDKNLALAAAIDAELKPLYELRSRAQGTISISIPNNDSKSGRGLLPKWSDIMRFVGTNGEASLGDMKNYADSKGYDLGKENNIRFQADNYTRKGWFERVNAGVFSLTEAGAKKCNYIKN